MASSSSRPNATAVLPDDGLDILPAVTCPMCHTSAALSRSALAAAGAWRCVRCGQHWDAPRLEAVAAYVAWRVDRDGAGRRSAGGGHGSALSAHLPTERLGGKP